MIHVLLCQIGTIEDLDAKSVKKYLRRFLSDDRIIDLPKILWRPILELIINIRYKKVLQFYKDIWTPHGSPLHAISLEQQKALQQELGDDYSVKLFLSYTEKHSIDDIYTKMQQEVLENLVVIPLFPQFSSATTSGIADTVFSKLLGWKSFSKKEKHFIPNIHFISNFYNNDTYKALYLAHIKKEIATLPKKLDTMIVSFHGLPRRFIKEGDVYQKHCEETFEYIKQAFSHDSIKFVLTYQSRFGAEKWLGPRTEDTVNDLARNHPDETIAIVCPGFVTDCLETLSEINRELRHNHSQHGGNPNNFFYIPCLNKSKEFIEFLAALIKK